MDHAIYGSVSTDWYTEKTQKPIGPGGDLNHEPSDRKSAALTHCVFRGIIETGIGTGNRMGNGTASGTGMGFGTGVGLEPEYLPLSIELVSAVYYLRVSNCA